LPAKQLPLSKEDGNAGQEVELDNNNNNNNNNDDDGIT
jgi:hypothetical protein